MPPSGRIAGAARQPVNAGPTPQMSPNAQPDIRPFVTCVKRLAGRGAEAGGSLRSVPLEDLDLLRPVGSTAGNCDELAIALRFRGSREFWHAALAVHAYLARDCQAVCEAAGQLRQQPNQPTGATGAEPPRVAQLHQEQLRCVHCSCLAATLPDFP